MTCAVEDLSLSFIGPRVGVLWCQCGDGYVADDRQHYKTNRINDNQWPLFDFARA